MAFSNFPYTDFHNLNIDWLLKTVKKLDATWEHYNAEWDKWQKDLQKFVNDYFSSLDVQEEINKKLDEMAQDGSLMTLFKKYIGYVMPEWFGCIGDGVTDDTANMQKAIAYCEKNDITLLCYTASKYLISDTLVLTGISCDFNNSTILITNTLNDGIIIKSENYNGFTKYRKFVKNLKLDALECKNAIRVNCAKYNIDNMSITTKNVGIFVDSGYENTFTGCNITGIENTTGIDINGNDHLFYDCICIDCKTGIVLRGVNRINNFHSWIYNDAIRYNSKTFDIKSGYNFLSQCYCDGTHYGLYWSNYGFIFSEEMFFLNGATFYKDNNIIPYCMYDSGMSKNTPFANNPTMHNTYINVLDGYKISNFNYLFSKENKFILDGSTKNIYYLRHNYNFMSSYFTVISSEFIEYNDKFTVYIEIQANTNIGATIIELYENTFLTNNIQFNGLVQENRYGKSVDSCTFYSSDGKIYLNTNNLLTNNVCSVMVSIPKELATNQFDNYYD